MHETMDNGVMVRVFKNITLMLLLCILTFICVAPIQARAFSTESGEFTEEILDNDSDDIIIHHIFGFINCFKKTRKWCFKRIKNKK